MIRIAKLLGCMAVLSVAFLLTIRRVVAGPTLPDRVLALDMLVGIVIGFIALIAIRTGFTLYIDIAISLGLVGFLATVAFARFILSNGRVAPKPKATIDETLMAASTNERRRATKRASGSGPAVRRKAKK